MVVRVASTWPARPKEGPETGKNRQCFPVVNQVEAGESKLPVQCCKAQRCTSSLPSLSCPFACALPVIG